MMLFYPVKSMSISSRLMLNTMNNRFVKLYCQSAQTASIECTYKTQAAMCHTVAILTKAYIDCILILWLEKTFSKTVFTAVVHIFYNLHKSIDMFMLKENSFVVTRTICDFRVFLHQTFELFVTSKVEIEVPPFLGAILYVIHNNVLVRFSGNSFTVVFVFIIIIVIITKIYLYMVEINEQRYNIHTVTKISGVEIYIYQGSKFLPF